MRHHELALYTLLHAGVDRENWCEWIACCYGCDPRRAVEKAIRYRHSHRGYMAHYPQALALVRLFIETGEQPLLASWF